MMQLSYQDLASTCLPLYFFLKKMPKSLFVVGQQFDIEIEGTMSLPRKWFPTLIGRGRVTRK